MRRGCLLCCLDVYVSLKRSIYLRSRFYSFTREDVAEITEFLLTAPLVGSVSRLWLVRFHVIIDPPSRCWLVRFHVIIDPPSHPRSIRPRAIVDPPPCRWLIHSRTLFPSALTPLVHSPPCPCSIRPRTLFRSALLPFVGSPPRHYRSAPAPLFHSPSRHYRSALTPLIHSPPCPIPILYRIPTQRLNR